MSEESGKKIKILRIITRLNNGGPAKHAIWLTSYLRKDRFANFLISGETEENEDSILWYAEEHDVYPIFINSLK